MASKSEDREAAKRLIKKESETDVLYHLFRENNEKISLQVIIKELQSAGLIFNRDMRLREFEKHAYELAGVNCFRDLEFNYDEFKWIIASRKALFFRALTRRLMIENFDEFSKYVDYIHELQKSNIAGQLCKEIPELQMANRNVWGVSVCSVDGQRKFAGDSQLVFTLQNLCKPMVYGFALNRIFPEKIHQYISYEPLNSGKETLEMNGEGIPYNTMLDTGSVMLCALINSSYDTEQKSSQVYEDYFNFVKDLVEDEYLEFNASAYLSKKDSVDILRCISHTLTSESHVPPDCNMQDCLDFYFKACSIDMKTESLSVFAATLANGGVNPFTGKQVIQQEKIKYILSAMKSFGLYGASGEIGLPMKSSISGGLIMIVPGKMGIALYSPLLNDNEISNRSYNFCLDLVNHLSLHPFHYEKQENVSKLFPNRRTRIIPCEPYCDLFAAASEDNVKKLIILRESKVDFYMTDHFGHTALHAAAVNGCRDVVNFLLEHCPLMANMKDRWGRTPRNYALYNNFNDIEKRLERAEAGALKDPKKK